MSAELLRRLESRLRSYQGRTQVVAFSGGVDSSVVLAVAARVSSPEDVLAVTAVSPSFPAGELERARDVAATLGVASVRVDTHEVEDPAYARNDARRCFHCKTELYSILRRVASVAGAGAQLLAGANADDRDDFRPGLRAAEPFGVRNPLSEEGMRKPDVRSVARLLELPVADKPAMACLSSRVAFGVAITPELLARIDRAEAMVRALGFTNVRVRHHGGRASVEVDPREVGALLTDARTPGLLDAMRAMGWPEVDVDPRGYRPGSMNATLFDLRPARTR